MELDIIKNISIQLYLQSIGFEPKNQSGNRVFYISPFRPGEKTASFVVRPKQNDYIDFATGQGGDIIKFIERYHSVDFKSAVRLLQSFDGSANISSFSFVCNEEVKSSFQLKKIKTLENKALLQYLAYRKINLSVARMYLKEAYYNVNEFALAFENDLGGFELRNKIRKFSTSPKTITSVNGRDKTALLLFEGFMDFLSYLTIKNIEAPDFDAVILNSTKNLHLAKDLLLYYSKIFSLMDNDDAGRKVHRELINYSKGSKVVDCSIRYAGYDDLNHYLMNLPFEC